MVTVGVTVTVTADVAALSHATVFCVDIVILLYCVVVVSPDGTSYVSPV